ncbi:MAG: EpsI family protein [Aquisalinus sp.]|nr:EpsI family protein [Aquisalinus sp.]
MTEVRNHSIGVRLCFMLTVGIIASLCVSLLSADAETESVMPELSVLLPETFGDWSIVNHGTYIRPLEQLEEDHISTLYRTYKHTSGKTISLVIAFGLAKGDAVRLHQPDVCYKAQGYTVKRINSSGEKTDLWPTGRLVADNGIRQETITYWLRVGDKVVTSAGGQQFANLQAGLGHSVDSSLVRISTNGQLSQQTLALHSMFIDDLMEAVSSEAVSLLIGERGEVYVDG